MKNTILISGIVLLLPFVVRIPQGKDWALQYLAPDPLTWIFVFLVCAIPILPVVLFHIFAKKRISLAFILSLMTTLYLTFRWHSNFDISEDAQSAIAFMFIPVCIAFFAFLAGAIGWGIEALKLRLT